MSIPEHLEPTVRTLPTTPGCYLYYNAKNEVIYVGKAVNLRNRVRSYFNPNTWVVSPKTGRLVKEIARIEFIVRGSELEALIQEAELIKHHKPHFNIRLKDDKRYPYLKVTWQDDFPTVTVTRRMEQDGARYYGPYSNAGAIYQTRDALRKMFPFLSCDRVITGQDKRACIYYDIKLCGGPCIGAVQRAEYRASIQRLCDFVEGKSDTVTQDLSQRMALAAENLQFERAAQYRDQLKAIQHITEKQRIVGSSATDQDVIAFSQDEGDTCVQVMFIRGGKLLGQEYFVLDGAEGEDEATVIDAFLKRFYDEAAYVPPEVLLPAQIEEAFIIENWLKQRSGHSVKLSVSHSQTDADLLALAKTNASETLTSLKAQWAEDSHRQEATLKELQEALDLPKLPTRIECFDISNTQGTAIVAAMVTFVHGLPRKSDYRRFNIRDIEGPNDFESMRQALTRRFQRWKDSEAPNKSQELRTKNQDLSADLKSKIQNPKSEDNWSLLPDLLLIDGGKGQLGIAVEVLRAFDLLHIVPVVSLAKQNEEIFVPGKATSIMLPRSAQAFYLVQRIRDEAHRYGIGTHRKQRQKIGMASRLDAIPGIGPQRRKRLLTQFGSYDGIAKASVEDLAKIVPIDVARTIKANTG
ncbi:MAG: excinuclease ABC subunit UvrC [Anaerolineae bacterium]|nr:excinuclease ABC subunit UvrC [Anaerolineae bacterium]